MPDQATGPRTHFLLSSGSNNGFFRASVRALVRRGPVKNGIRDVNAAQRHALNSAIESPGWNCT
jgi:hypothetical protein